MPLDGDKVIHEELLDAFQDVFDQTVMLALVPPGSNIGVDNSRYAAAACVTVIAICVAPAETVTIPVLLDKPVFCAACIVKLLLPILHVAGIDKVSHDELLETVQNVNASTNTTVELAVGPGVQLVKDTLMAGVTDTDTGLLSLVVNESTKVALAESVANDVEAI